MQLNPMGHVSLISGKVVVESASKKDKIGVSVDGGNVGRVAITVVSVGLESVTKKDKIGVSVGGGNVGRVATVVSAGLGVGSLLQQTSALPQGIPNSASFR